jgi:glycosyltransferase involved in cell wall biosynthesis
VQTLLLTLEFPPDDQSGISSWAWDLAWALHRSGDEVTVLAKAGPKAKQSDESLPFRVIRMHGRSWGRWQGLWARIAGGRQLRSSHRVIFSTWRLAVHLAPRAAAQGCRVGVAAHGSDLTREQKATPGLLAVDECLTSWLPVSSFLETELRRLGLSGASQVLPMPLRTERTSLPYEERQGLIFLARMTPLKGVDRAISLARAIKEPLILIGDGPARDAHAGTAQTGVSFLGALPRDVSLEHISRARAMVLLPRSDADGSGAEGLGLCLLEAATYGVPAIACRTGGVAEAAQTGLLIDPDTPDIQAVRELLADPDAGVRAQQWVQQAHGPGPCLRVLDEALR